MSVVDAERWIGEVRSVKQAHEKDGAVRGRLKVRIVEGRNLPTK